MQSPGACFTAHLRQDCVWRRKPTDLFLQVQSAWTEHLLTLTPKALGDPCMGGTRHPPHAGQKASPWHFSIWTAFLVSRDGQHTASLRSSAPGFRLLFHKCQNVVFQSSHRNWVCYRAISASPPETGKELGCIEYALHMHLLGITKAILVPHSKRSLKNLFETMTRMLISKIYSHAASRGVHVPLAKDMNQKAHNVFAARMRRRERPTFIFVFCLYASIRTQGILTSGWGPGMVKSPGCSTALAVQHAATSPVKLRPKASSHQLTKELDFMTPKQVH